jgi:hypothetical protein
MFPLELMTGFLATDVGVRRERGRGGGRAQLLDPIKAIVRPISLGSSTCSAARPC